MTFLRQIWHDIQVYSEQLWHKLHSWTGNVQESSASADESTLWALNDVLRLAQNPGADTSMQRSEALTLSPLDAGDPRFVAREKELASLLAALELWRSGRPAMAVVTGPQGSGITSLVNQLQLHIQPEEVLRRECLSQRLRNEQDVFALIASLFDLRTHPDDYQGLVALLNQLPARILFIDDAHFLASRIFGARDAVRSLGAIMVATQGHHLWLLGCGHHAWRRMCYTHQAERFFSHAIALDYFNVSDLTAFVMARLSAAGDEPPEAPQTMLQRLHSLSRGKPDLVLLYLLSGPEQNGTAFRPLDTAVFKQLEMDDLFTLAELAVHGSMTLAEHRQIFRLSQESSQLRLNMLCNWGLVERRGEVGGSEACYRILSMVSAHLSDYLYKTNYLY